jgi:multicomponent Na+:H+ antiporter subunit D
VTALVPPPVPPALALLVAAALVRLLPRRTGHLVGALAAAGVVPWLLSLTPGVTRSARLFGFEVTPVALDAVSLPVGLVFAFVAAANVVYAYGTGASRGQTATALAYMGASLGAVLAGDWLTLVVWWELMAAAATVLVWQSADARRAGYRYAVYHQLGGALLIAGVLAHYATTGTFGYGGGVVGGLPRLLAFLGVALNVGVLGFHVWLVDTYPRPHVAASVVLCGFTTKVGVYTLLRVLPGRSLPVAYLGGAMLLVGVTLAVLQTDTRRLLTYHIVSQVGYMVAGVGIATSLAIDGALFHLVNNVLYKTLLFMIAGLLLLRTGHERLKAIDGRGRAMPVTAGAFAVAALAITGVPGFAGFVSKGIIVDSAEAAGLDALWWMLVVGGVGTVISFAKFGYYAFVPHGSDADAVAEHEPPTATGTPAERPRAQVLALGLLAVPCVVLGLVPDLAFGVVPGGGAGAKAFAGSQFTKAGATLAAGLVGFVVLRGPLSRLPAVPDLDVVYHPLGAATRDGLTTATTRVAKSVTTLTGAGIRAAWAGVVAPGTAPRLAIGPAGVGRGLLLVVLVAALSVGLVLLG